jgi:hypothetical protein
MAVEGSFGDIVIKISGVIAASEVWIQWKILSLLAL